MKSGVKNIVTVGGGTGSYTVLSGLKNLPNVSISAIVSMADDGSSSGILRSKWNVLPPGDVRQCLVALSGKKILNKKIMHGFFKEHKLGNIFLALLEKITGNFSRGLKIISLILQIKGEIIPVTLDQAILCARLKNGNVIVGESNINKENFLDIESVHYQSKVSLNKEVEKSIETADYIIICPGSFYTSIMPNLIIGGMKEIIEKSKAKIIAIENMGPKEVDNYSEIIERYLGRQIYNLISGDKSLAEENDIERYDSVKLAKVIEKIINK